MGLQRVGHDWATELNWTDRQHSCRFTCFCTKYFLVDKPFGFFFFNSNDNLNSPSKSIFLSTTLWFRKNKVKCDVEEWIRVMLSRFSFSSIQFSRSVLSDSLRPHESQHARPPCPSPTPGIHPDSHPSSQWCHPAISSSVVPFSSCPQSLPESEYFPMSQLFAWGG